MLSFAAAFVFILYVLQPFDEAINRSRASHWLCVCGLFPSSIYLPHAPVGVRVYGLGTRFISTGITLYDLLALSFCLVSVLFSHGFYRIFEARLEIWRRRCKARPISAVV